MDNKKDTGHPDRDEIDINEEYEVRYWSNKWGITDNPLFQTLCILSWSY